jgi:hypothetical protein
MGINMHTPGVGNIFPCFKCKNWPPIDDRGGILVGAPKSARDHHGETKLMYSIAHYSLTIYVSTIRNDRVE